MENKEEDKEKSDAERTARILEPRLGKRILYIFPFAFLAVVVVLVLAYVLVLLPLMTEPISEKLSEDINPQRSTVMAYHEADTETEKQTILTQITFPTQLHEPPLLIEATPEPEVIQTPSVCNYDSPMIFLLVGTDSKTDTYRSGLADVIRLIRVDFANRKINMIALPRDMVIEFPEGRTDMASPMKINQAYYLGTEAVSRYVGGGNGAHSLAEAIDYNFGVKTDHYMVVNFTLVRSLIDAVGGVDVDLPKEVEDEYFGYYPSGPQHLDGLEALVLMRIRMKYTDDFRVSNQTIVLKAMFEKMKTPNMMTKIPSLIREFRENLLTDLSVEELIRLGNCLSKEFEVEDIHAAQFSKEHIQAGREYIPSANLYLFVYKWGDEAVQFIHETLMKK